jgi:hypothetical protein
VVKEVFTDRPTPLSDVDALRSEREHAFEIVTHWEQGGETPDPWNSESNAAGPGEEVLEEREARRKTHFIAMMMTGHRFFVSPSRIISNPPPNLREYQQMSAGRGGASHAMSPIKSKLKRWAVRTK